MIKLKKATLVRCFLSCNDKSLENSLYWLSPIIESFVQIKSEHNYFFRNLIKVLRQLKTSEEVCDWTLELSGQIQSLLTDEGQIDAAKCIFLCDLFTIACIVTSGVDCLYGNPDEIALSRQKR